MAQDRIILVYKDTYNAVYYSNEDSSFEIVWVGRNIVWKPTIFDIVNKTSMAPTGLECMGLDSDAIQAIERFIKLYPMI